MVRRTAIGLVVSLLALGCHLIAGVEEGTLRPEGTAGGGAATAGGAGGGGGAGQGGEMGGAAGMGGELTGGSSGVGGMIPGMINIPGDTFMMGCNDGVDNLCNTDEAPYHSVTLTGYRIDIFEVTRADYTACIDDGACNTPPCDYDATGLPDHPVTCVTWQDAADYCTWAGKRLPTEAQWEYAARASATVHDGRRYPWGNAFAADCTLANGNLCLLDTSPVGDHPTGASPVGALDMAGNVGEWVNDFYDQTYYASSPSTDPTGPASGALRVIRGGGWNSSVSNFRNSARDANIVTFNNNEIGFRCAN